MQNINHYRQLFPHLEDCIYLNHAAVGPMHQRSMEATQRLIEDRSLRNIAYWPDLMDAKHRFKELTGKLINSAAENIAVTSSTSMGLNWLAQGLEWHPGDRILLNNFEFPANVYPFLNLEQSGVQVDFVEHREGIIRVEDLAAKIRPETRLLSISFVEFLNGYRNDLKQIGELCAQNDIIFCVDSIQGIGALQLDVQELNIDFVACGGQKWLLWPMGTAFFYLSPRIFDLLQPMALGWLSVENTWDFFEYRTDLLPTAERFEPGIFNVMGVVAANASLELFLEVGPENIEKRILENTAYLISQLQDGGYHLFTPIEEQYRSGIVTFNHPRAEKLFEYLKNNKIYLSLRDGMIRISPHFYNAQGDLDYFISMLRKFDQS